MHSPRRWLLAAFALAVASIPMLSIGQDELDVPPVSTAPPREPSRRDEVPPPIEEFRYGKLDTATPPPNDVRVSGPNEALAEVLIDVNPTNPLTSSFAGTRHPWAG
jgi:hypothetical protein